MSQQPPEHPYGQPQPWQPQSGQPPSGQPQPWQPSANPYGPPPDPTGAPGPGQRPGAVIAATVITMVMSAIVLLGCAVGALGLLGDREQALREFERAITEDEALRDAAVSAQTILDVTTGVVIGAAVWSLLALVVAALALAGQNWARILTMISAGFASVVGICTLVVPAAGITTIVLLAGRRASEWYATRSEPMPPGIQPPASPSQPWG